MSYCVNCGVELDATARACPLCQTPVMIPASQSIPPLRRHFPRSARRWPPFPAGSWPPALSHAGLCGGVLRYFESLFAAGTGMVPVCLGAAIMVWIWLVPPLLMRGLHLLLRLVFDVVAVALYVYLISLDLNGEPWFMGLALPIILTGGAVVLFLGLVLQHGKRSILSGITICIGAAGVVAVFAELFVDRWLYSTWNPDWSLIVLTVCVALIIPLLIVRRVPSLREEARRRFHM